MTFVPTTAATLTGGSAGSPGVNPPGRRQEDDINLVPTIAACLSTSNQRIDAETETFIPTTFDWQAGSSGDTSWRGKARSWIVDQPDRTRSLVANRTLAVAYESWQGPLQQDQIVSPDDVSPTLCHASNTHSGHHEPMVMAFSENQRGEVLEGDISHQLTTGGGKPGQGYPAVRDGMAVRRLMPIECERLQGFPDGWTDAEKDSARYRLLGNAVCVPVAEWIGKRIGVACG